jgi:serine/threonine protein phosphatase PrpC
LFLGFLLGSRAFLKGRGNGPRTFREEAAMLTQPLHRVETLPWHAASRRGPRRINADATAVYQDPTSGRLAFVVADGVGDSFAAASAARLAADTAARAAVTVGPAQAILAAQRALLAAAPGSDDGDCVLVVAVPGAYSCEVAWVGDCAAYQSNGRVLERITVDHTLAEFFRSRHQPVTPRMAHLVTTSIRTVKPDRIGASRTGLAAGRLLLCSDGVHKTLSDNDIRRVLDHPGTAERTAELMVDTALELGGRDNATAMVVEHAIPAEPDLAA